jgi:glycosyltransferase involved in cell wall biosynthesis
VLGEGAKSKVFYEETDYYLNHINIDPQATMRIGVAIPCYKYHIPQLKRCLDSIAKQSVVPDDVVVSCSSTNPGDIPQYSYPFPLRVISTPEKKNAAENRNIAASYLTTDIVSFFDADDEMHPQRLEAIRDAFQGTPGCDIVLHSFWKDTQNSKSWEIYKNFDIRPNSLARASSGCAVYVPSQHERIHHSQVSVSEHILNRMKFNEDSSVARREDSLFCGDILASPNCQNAYIAVPLSKYYMEGTTYTV